MFHKYNSFTNTLSPSDQISSLLPESFGTKATTNNFFVAPQPKGRFTAAQVAKTPVALLSEKVAAAPSAVSHGHSHVQPWEGVNLWRTPYKGDTDTITQVKRNKGTLDQYVENRTRKLQQMQIFALRNKSIPTWIMMPRDKLILGVQVALAGYVLFQVGSMVYQNLKAKDRIKLLKLLYKDNVN